MVGSRVVALGVLGAILAVATTSGRADACSVPPPPLALVGSPVQGERDVPTNVVPVYSIIDANLYEAARLASAGFSIESASGSVVAVAQRMPFVWHFELVPETELEPHTEYTVRATLPATDGAQTPTPVAVSFVTGAGRFAGDPAPPDARMQHYHATVSAQTSCDPPTDGSCIFFSPGMTVEVTNEGDNIPYLYFGPWMTNLSGVNQGTPWTCATLRTRAPSGAFSAPVNVCREHAETVRLTSLRDLECTENGIRQGGVLRGGTGDDDSGKQTVLTEAGCGCRTWAAGKAAALEPLLAACLVLLARLRRRSAR
jgi:hypothetical protein